MSERDNWNRVGRPLTRKLDGLGHLGNERLEPKLLLDVRGLELFDSWNQAIGLMRCRLGRPGMSPFKKITPAADRAKLSVRTCTRRVQGLLR